jgi:predicted lipoprotein
MKKAKFLTLTSTAVRVAIFAVLIVSLPMMLSACKLYTVVKLNPNVSNQDSGFSSENNNFDGDKYVNSVWDSKALPYVSKKAADITQVLNAIKQNLDGAGKQFGIRDNSEGSSWNFLVKGRGKIIATDTTSRAGTADIDLPPYDGKKDLVLQIGPVIQGSSVRDSLGFISFDNFENQIEYAQLGDAFNKKVYQQVLSKIKFAALKGKEIQFSGAFTMDSSDILLTPILLKEN